MLRLRHCRAREEESETRLQAHDCRTKVHLKVVRGPCRWVQSPVCRLRCRYARAEPSSEVTSLNTRELFWFRRAAHGARPGGRSRAADHREAHQVRYGEHLQADVLEDLTETTLRQRRWARSLSEAFSASPHVDASSPKHIRARRPMHARRVNDKVKQLASVYWRFLKAGPRGLLGNSRRNKVPKIVVRPRVYPATTGLLLPQATSAMIERGNWLARRMRAAAPAPFQPPQSYSAFPQTAPRAATTTYRR